MRDCEHLPGLFLIEIDRGSETITPVTPQDVIRAGDHLIFTGVVTTIADLERIPGLVPAVDTTFEKAPAKRTSRQLTEAVLSRTSPLIGLNVRESDFRKRYNAAVVAVHRNGERLTNKVGNIRLEPGDTLLLQTRNEFVEAHRHSRDFYLVSRVGATTARRHDRALVAGLLFVGLIVWLTICSLWPNLLPWGNVMAPNIHAIIAIGVVLAMIVTRLPHDVGSPLGDRPASVADHRRRTRAWGKRSIAVVRRNGWPSHSSTSRLPWVSRPTGNHTSC